MIRHIHLLLVLAALLGSGCSNKSTSTGTPPSTPVRPPAIPMVSATDCPPGIITTIASSGHGGDHSSVDLMLNLLDGIAAGPKGDIYIADTKSNRIRKIDKAGVITTVAGTGHSGFSGDGGPAVKAELDNPTDLAVAPDGSLYIADHNNWGVRKVDPAGVITTVAGGGKNGNFTDRIRATKAHLLYVTAIAVGLDGSLFIGGNRRIRKVDKRGIITTVAGDGNYAKAEEGGRPEGVPALKVSLRSVHGLAVGYDGSLYFAIWDDHQVCKIDPKGIIHTIAGNGVGRRPANVMDWLHVAHFSGDGGPATKASLACPHDVALGPNGSIYIADSENKRVRKVSPKGIITTVAGAGRKAPDGDGVPATTVSLGYFHHIAVAPNGILYIVTENRIRKVCPTR